MEQSLIFLIMGLAGLFFAGIPFGVYMGLSSMMGLTDVNSTSLLLIMYIITIVAAFLGSFGGYALIQNHNCGGIKNMKQIAGNAALTTVIVVLTLSLSVFIPGFKHIVTNLLSPEIEPRIKESLGYSYFLFWGALYGFASGGYMSAVCGSA